MNPNTIQGPHQLVFELPHRQALGAEDFLVSGSNGGAVEFVDRWPDWAVPSQMLVGPEGSGKTHLAHVWQLRSGASCVEASHISDEVVSNFERLKALVVENADRGIRDERVLFHLLNMTRERGFHLLLTSRALPGEIPVSLPDLRSRLRAIPVVRIGPPDEALLKSVLVKLFADRQLAVEPHVIDYIGLHLERSMAAAGRVVAGADRLSLALGRKVTRAVAAEALRQLSNDEVSD
jgi:chromosomal replication initiation ATPase DnaA